MTGYDQDYDNDEYYGESWWSYYGVEWNDCDDTTPNISSIVWYADYDGDGLGSSCYKESNYFPYDNDGINGDSIYNNQVIYQCSDPNDDDGFVDPNTGHTDENTQSSFICDQFVEGYNNCDDTSNGTWVALQYVSNNDEYCNEYESSDYDADNDGIILTSDCDDSDENISSADNNPPLYPDWDGDGKEVNILLMK